MEKTELDGAADHLLRGYLDVADYRRVFIDDHEFPPSLMAKIHHFRSVVMALLTRDDQFDLHDSYTDYGKVEFTDRGTGRVLLLRSAAAVQIEATQKHEQLIFAGMPEPALGGSTVQLLVYRFDKHGLHLSIADTVQKKDRGQRLFANGTPHHVGLWPYTDSSTPPFNQDAADVFGEIGDLDLEAGDGG